MQLCGRMCGYILFSKELRTSLAARIRLFLLARTQKTVRSLILDLTWMRHVCGSDMPSENGKQGPIWRSLARNFDHFHVFGVIQILRESIIVFRNDSSFFSWILMALLAPLSAVILCQILVTGPVIKRLAWQMEAAAQMRSFLANPLHKTVLLMISENVVSNGFCSPFFITLSLLSKASISYKVACMYAGHQPLFPSFLTAVLKIYKHLLLTYIWICLSTFGSVTSFTLWVVIVTALFQFLRFSADIVFLVSTVSAIIFCVFFAHLLVICNLANVVSVLEDKYGSSALIRAFSLIKGRTQVALLLLLLSTTMATLIDGLFQYRVVGRPNYHYSKDIPEFGRPLC
ncbi:hypothetical protein O6H91_15G033100 [Diphasiastrum complanatum]|uniref:Uncharacterized protein n=1 Tax=Diphasiastrum complanatum TaxID=34168 RepID=A0ACC2BH13_DIPCM|nr:hypothetical protein O6H91_15G033100 [Diphasiastrum complanatum]